MRQRPSTTITTRSRRLAPDEIRRAIVPLGLWFGLVTGIAEVLLQIARRRFIGQFSYAGGDVVWLTPLVDTMIFGAIGLVFSGMARRWFSEHVLQIALTAYAALSAWIILMMYQPLHPAARIVLAAGLAVQFGRTSTRRAGWILPRIQSMLAWPTVLVRRLRGQRSSRHEPALELLGRRDFLIGTGVSLGVLGAGVRIPTRWREWSGVRSLPSARAGAPNVLLLVLDTVRAASLSLHGYPRATSPELTRLAGRGAFFERAYSHSPWTLPSHGSLFTGRYPHELSGTWQRPLDAADRVIPEVLSDAGYVTAGFVANTNYCSYESGLHRGYLRYEDYTISGGEILRSSVVTSFIAEHDAVARQRKFELLGRKSARTINQDFLSWLSKQGDRPFFAFLNYFDAHAPYLPPPPFAGRFGPDVDRPNPRHLFAWTWTREQSTAEQDAYDGAVAYLDAEVGRLLATLDAQRLLDRTLVVITSDHGELFGEHGLMDHANSLYVPLLHVPLLMIWPGQIPAGTVVRQPVGLRHVAATILDLLQIEPARLPGSSLAPLWRGGNLNGGIASEPIFSSLEQGIRVEPHWRNYGGHLHSVIVGDRHYIRNSDGSEELYDLTRDPAEAVNLAGTLDMAMYRTALERFLRDGSTRP